MTMKEKNVLLFDLDGTLTDPGEGITNSVRYALKKFGIEVSDRKELYRFIGPPLAWGFETFYGFSPFFSAFPPGSLDSSPVFVVRYKVNKALLCTAAN